MIPDLLSALRSGAVLVTANARLARDLRRQYDEHCRDAGEAVWESPSILPWEAWMERAWSECVGAAPVPEPVLLSAAQEQVLWERAIEESPQGPALLSVAATAAAAAAAYRLACRWELPLDEDGCRGFEDAAAFRGWALRFEKEQRSSGWLPAARLAVEIAHRVEGGRLAPPARLLYAGFDEVTPSERRLFGALEAAGGTVEEATADNRTPGMAHRAALRDRAGEIRAAAEWARARLEASPTARIGVVVPDLSVSNAVVERIFDEVLDPSLDMTRARGGRAYHVSAGAPLAEVPVAAAALAVLGLGRVKLPLALVGLLLRSPFLGGAREERAARAQLDAELRRRGMGEVGVAAVARLAAATTPDGAGRPYRSPQLARRLRAWRRAAERMPARLGAASWSRLFSRLLQLAGWPGDRTPDSAEFQAIERWNELLSEFAALDHVARPMEYSAALARLGRMAGEARFVPADDGAPIQVMGMLEAAGARFDHLWVTGLEDRVWPAPPRPNPFLPAPLQRDRGAPHCSAARELDYARRLTARLAASASEVVMSYALNDGDTVLRPSPLIAGLPEMEAAPEGPRMAHVLRRGAAALEETGDRCGPPLAAGAVQRGGMGVFEKQAACPFRAFAEYRLGARALDEPVAGLSPQERGKILHAALENIWHELGSHRALMALAPEGRAEVVSRAVAAALAAQARGRGAEAMPRIQVLEGRRLEGLLNGWLQVEAGRAPFTVVASERGRRVEIGGLAVDIQVDRVDRLADRRHVVIDYKTGNVSPSQWEGARPDAPQLPLYAATLEGPVAAVLFAQTAPGKLRFNGLAEAAGVPSATEYRSSKAGREAGDTLADHIAAWRAVLEDLAREFAAGGAAVSPKGPQVCERCHLAALCRIGESMRPVEDAREPAHE